MDIEHDDRVAHSYATKEAAFEAAVAAASLAMRQGHEIVITASPAVEETKPSAGARD